MTQDNNRDVTPLAYPLVGPHAVISVEHMLDIHPARILPDCGWGPKLPGT